MPAASGRLSSATSAPSSTRRPPPFVRSSRRPKATRPCTLRAPTSPVCASWAVWASPSTPKPGCGTTRTSAASAARSWTLSGRPKPVVTSSPRCPWPSMIRTIWNDPERFKKSYFPEELKGYYLAGDGAVRSADRGYFRITGRIDDVLNVSGHRMGTMEIESALVAKTDLVAEAAVVGRPDDVTGEAICAFVVLKRSRPTGEEAKQIANELRNWVAKEIGPIAKPKDIRFGDNLPKTRSGKIMRRLLRSIAKGEQITQDTSTLENPAILDKLAQTN